MPCPMRGTCDFPAHTVWRRLCVHNYTQCGHRKEGVSLRLRFDVTLYKTAGVHMLYIVFKIRKKRKKTKPTEMEKKNKTKQKQSQ